MLVNLVKTFSTSIYIHNQLTEKLLVRPGDVSSVTRKHSVLNRIIIATQHRPIYDNISDTAIAALTLFHVQPKFISTLVLHVASTNRAASDRCTQRPHDTTVLYLEGGAMLHYLEDR